MPTTRYDIYPAFRLQSGSIECGYDQLAKLCCNHRIVIIDGYVGIFWEEFRKLLDDALQKAEFKVQWIDFSKNLKPQSEIDSLLIPFLGGDDILFGTRCKLELIDFFDAGKIREISIPKNTPLTIIYGCGSFLSNNPAFKIYLDLPKAEIQKRSKEGSICNLGCDSPADHKSMYKRFYFVDWIVLNKHKQRFIQETDVFGDIQNTLEIRYAEGSSIRETFSAMSENYFRVRPWFEPGVWGGTWIKDHIKGLNSNVPNYAWSFELIVPENGLLFEKDARLMELSFDWLMFQEAQHILGEDYQRFGTEFPIRFDFLDTFDGGNLSIQVHPRPDYMKEHFGEDFTQEECYYILDTKENAQVYLGFTDTIEENEFQEALEKSFTTACPLNIANFVQKHPASKHDLFLIPYGTIHGSGKNNLVLEISSTPYIFTFKLYDWVRPDLDGKPRPLNISRGMENLYFNRKGEKVRQELISRPVLLEKGNDWECWHLPTHETHLYDVHRYYFNSDVTIKTSGKCHVLSLVDSTMIEIYTQKGMVQTFNYAETFVIPAAAISYTVKNLSKKAAMLVIAFVK